MCCNEFWGNGVVSECCARPRGHAAPPSACPRFPLGVLPVDVATYAGRTHRQILSVSRVFVTICTPKIEQRIFVDKQTIKNKCLLLGWIHYAHLHYNNNIITI